MSGIFVSGVFSDPVYTCYIALILYGTGFQEGIPGRNPLLRPARNIYYKVIIGTCADSLVAAEYREPQVVADLQQDPYALVFDYDPFFARGIAEMLSAVGEEMVLIVVSHGSVRLYEVKPGSICARGLFPYGETAGYRAVARGRKLLHKLQAFAVVAFGDTLRLSHETGCKHFGEYDEIRIFLAHHQLSYTVPVGGRILPDLIRLNKRQFHFLRVACVFQNIPWLAVEGIAY